MINCQGRSLTEISSIRKILPCLTCRSIKYQIAIAVVAEVALGRR